jgi:hypothetical protein
MFNLEVLAEGLKREVKVAPKVPRSLEAEIDRKRRQLAAKWRYVS